MKPNTELIDRRERLKMTHDEVAQQVGISRPYYTNIEAGRKVPSMKVAKAIADVLKTRVDKIFFSDNVPNRNERRFA